MPEHELVERAYKNLGPWARADQTGQLLAFLKVLLDPLLAMDDIARDDDPTPIADIINGSSLSSGSSFFSFGGVPLGYGLDVIEAPKRYQGWGSLMDVSTTPEWALPWLAQFVGVRTITGLDDASQRIRIRSAAGFSRGTPSSIIAAARQYLTGQRKVELYEREGSPWKFRLRTYSSETPFPEKVRAAVESLKPAGIVFDYEIQEGIEINDLIGTIDGLVGTIDSYSTIIPV